MQQDCLLRLVKRQPYIAAYLFIFHHPNQPLQYLILSVDEFLGLWAIVDIRFVFGLNYDILFI